MHRSSDQSPEETYVVTVSVTVQAQSAAEAHAKARSLVAKRARRDQLTVGSVH